MGITLATKVEDKKIRFTNYPLFARNGHPLLGSNQKI